MREASQTGGLDPFYECAGKMVKMSRVMKGDTQANCTARARLAPLPANVNCLQDTREPSGSGLNFSTWHEELIISTFKPPF